MSKLKGPDGRIPDRLPDGRPAVAWERRWTEGTLPLWLVATAGGFLFVYTGLAYDAFGTPRPDSYFQASESKAPVVTQRYDAKSQLDLRTK